MPFVENKMIEPGPIYTDDFPADLLNQMSHILKSRQWKNTKEDIALMETALNGWIRQLLCHADIALEPVSMEGLSIEYAGNVYDNLTYFSGYLYVVDPLQETHYRLPGCFCTLAATLDQDDTSFNQLKLKLHFK